MTRADRLAAICARFAPAAKYVIHTLEGTGRKIVVEDPVDGSRIGASGESLDAALDALDAKVPAKGDQ